MNDLDYNVCAQCSHFKMKEYPQHAKVGLGRCMGYDKPLDKVGQPFISWKLKTCARFKLASNVTARKEWMENRLAKEHEEAKHAKKG